MLKFYNSLQADTNEEMLEWIGVIQKLNDNQSLCNSLIKKKADELLKADPRFALLQTRRVVMLRSSLVTPPPPYMV